VERLRTLDVAAIDGLVNLAVGVARDVAERSQRPTVNCRRFDNWSKGDYGKRVSSFAIISAFRFSIWLRSIM
jgi:hypothetical protein